MTVKPMHARLIIAFTALAIPTAAQANLIWPALYVEERLLSLPVIALGLLVETLVLRYLFAMEWTRALAASLVVNAISTVLGILLIPLAGVAWEVFPGLVLYKALDIGTFSPITWVATFLLALAITTSIEVASLVRLFRVPSGRRTSLYWTLANVVTVGAAFASFVIKPTTS